MIGFLGRYFGGFWKKRVPVLYVKLMQDMYDEARANVKSMCGETENFTMKVGVY